MEPFKIFFSYPIGEKVAPLFPLNLLELYLIQLSRMGHLHAQPPPTLIFYFQV